LNFDHTAQRVSDQHVSRLHSPPEYAPANQPNSS
jgi:hypothetical protein